LQPFGQIPALEDGDLVLFGEMKLFSQLGSLFLFVNDFLLDFFTMHLNSYFTLIAQWILFS
jgi:hypothetical protein